jgi:plasmid stabilization system protein ParE
MRFRFSRRAEADLEEITAYIARDNPARPVSFVR